MSERLPVGWSSTRLGDIAFEVRNGISARPDGDAGTRILRISAVRPMLLNKGDTRFLSGPSTSWETYRLRTDDLLFTRYNGNPSLVGVCARVELSIDDVLVYPDKLIRVRLNERIGVPAFVEKAVHVGASRAFIEGKTKTSAGQVGISGSDLKDVPILLPPLNEQRRIVAKLEALQARSRRAREALDTVPALLEKLRQSILAAAFRGDLTKDWRAKHPDVEPASELLKRIRSERRRRWEESELAKLKAKGKPPTDDKWKAKYKEPDPVDTTGLPELPKGWCWASVEELSTKVVDGVHKKPSYVPKGIPFLTVKNLTAGPGISFNDVNHVTVEDHEEFIKRTDPERGDLLISKDGTLGVTRLIRTDATFSIFVSLALVKPVVRAMGEYLEAAFLSPIFQARFKATGSGLLHIHLVDLRATALPVAPLEEQEIIAEKTREAIARLDVSKGHHHMLLGFLASLDRAVLAKAFRGELVPQDPNDEPADAMLARLARAGESGASA